jgi:hypothetical protein
VEQVEHRLFCHITQNWRGNPLLTLETLVDLIGNTRTAAGLRVRAKIDNRTSATGVTVTRTELKKLALVLNRFHGEWNYELRPRKLEQ